MRLIIIPNKIFWILFYFTTLLFFFSGCETYLRINVSVNDFKTNKPISNSSISLIDGSGKKSHIFYANENGKIVDSILMAYSKKRNIEMWVESSSYNTLKVNDRLYNWTKDSTRIFYMERLK